MISTISYSQVSKFLKCPRQWMFKYLKRIPESSSGYALQGIAYHEALATNFSYKLRNEQDLPISDVLDAYSTAWVNSLYNKSFSETGPIEGIVWEEDPGKLKDSGIICVESYHAKIAPSVKPKLVEETLKKSITPKVSITGRLDLVTKEDLLVDHKLKGRRMAQADVDRDIQPSTYLFLLGKKSGNIAYHVAIRGKDIISIMNTSRTEEEMNWWNKFILDVILQMNSGVYPPNPTGWWCSETWCPYWKVCRDYKGD